MNDASETNAAEKAAQHLADLLGTPVAGFLPSQADQFLSQIDLDLELFRRRNVGLAALVLLAMLVKNDGQSRARLIADLRPEYFTQRSVEHFLFVRIMEALSKQQEITAETLAAFVRDYGPTVWLEPPSERSLAGHYFKVAQILSIKASDAQIEQALVLRRDWAERRGYVSA